MSRIFKTTAAIVMATTIFAGAPVMAGGFIKFDGIEGESTLAGGSVLRSTKNAAAGASAARDGAWSQEFRAAR